MSAVDGPGLGDHCARHALLTQYLERDRSVDEFHHATRDRFTRLTVVAHLELHGICTEKRDGKIVVILSVRNDESTDEILILGSMSVGDWLRDSRRHFQ